VLESIKQLFPGGYIGNFLGFF